MNPRMTQTQTDTLQRATRRGLLVCAAVLGVPICLALVVLFIAMRDYYALHDAAARGDLARAEEILARHPERIERRDKGRQTPLHIAAWEGRAEMIALLLRHGADVHAKWDLVASGDGGWTALHIAARGDVRPVEVLLAGGADINVKSEAGETPLDVAVRRGKKDTAALLRERGGVSGKSGR
jgi:ankyrin repeat protein